MRYQVRVSEVEDEITSVRLSNLSEMPCEVSDQQPGIFRSWHGLVGAFVAGFGWGIAGWVIWCVLARIFT